MPVLENAQHELFVQELVKGKKHGEAYLAAGYNAKSVSVASAAATRLLKDVKIASRLSELLESRKAKIEEDASLTLEAHMAKLRELRDQASAEGKFQAAITAEVKRGELRRFYVKQVETGNPNDFDRMSLDELNQLIAEGVRELPASVLDGLLPKGRKAATKH